MKKQTFITLALLAIAGRATAQNTILCPDITAQGGQQVELPIALTSDEELTVVGISFTLTLPEGATFKKKTNGKPVYALVESRLDPEDFSVTPEFYSDNSLGVRIYTTSSTAVLQGTEGTVMTFTLDIDESMEAGEHDISLTENKLSIKNSGNTVTSLVIDNYKSKLTITEAGDGRIHFNETSATLPTYTAGEKGDVSMTRTIKANEWSTLVLPFNLTKANANAIFGSDVQFAMFDGYTIDYGDDEENVTPLGITINFTSYTIPARGNLAGGTPVLIKTTKAITKPFELDNVTLTEGVKEVIQNDPDYSFPGKFKSTLVKTKVPADGLFLSDNKFWYSNGKTTIKAFRGWFELGAVLDKETDFGVKMYVMVDDDPTMVEGISTDVPQGAIYDLSGRKLEKVPQKGIYLINGKKILK